MDYALRRAGPPVIPLSTWSMVLRLSSQRVLPSVHRTPRTTTKARLKLPGKPISIQLKSTASRQLSSMPGTSSNYDDIMTGTFGNATSMSASWCFDGSSPLRVPTNSPPLGRPLHHEQCSCPRNLQAPARRWDRCGQPLEHRAPSPLLPVEELFTKLCTRPTVY